MNSSSRLSLHRLSHAPHAPSALELPFALFLALIYVGLSGYFVFQWAGTTASLGGLDPAGFEDSNR